MDGTLEDRSGEGKGEGVGKRLEKTRTSNVLFIFGQAQRAFQIRTSDAFSKFGLATTCFCNSDLRRAFKFGLVNKFSDKRSVGLATCSVDRTSEAFIWTSEPKITFGMTNHRIYIQPHSLSL
jgi:hypothetical protein